MSGRVILSHDETPVFRLIEPEYWFACFVEAENVYQKVRDARTIRMICTIKYVRDHCLFIET